MISHLHSSITSFTIIHSFIVYYATEAAHIIHYTNIQHKTQKIKTLSFYTLASNNNNNNNNNNDNVYGAVLMTMVTARVHPVHLMNAN